MGFSGCEHDEKCNQGDPGLVDSSVEYGYLHEDPWIIEWRRHDLQIIIQCYIVDAASPIVILW